MKVEWCDVIGVELHPGMTHRDDRGTFVKHYDAGHDAVTARQVCTSFNHLRGTVRGLHLQLPPFEETKLVWCTSGELWDVMVDTRREQPTFGCWANVRLAAGDGNLLVVPPGVAHGYQTLSDNTSVAYVIDGEYRADAARTVAWNDPSIGVAWPLDVTAISADDRKGTEWPPS